jgi:hypothetical protein
MAAEIVDVAAATLSAEKFLNLWNILAFPLFLFCPNRRFVQHRIGHEVVNYSS